MIRLLALAMLVPAVAAAQDLDGAAAPIGVHVNAGLEFLGGAEALSVGLRVHVGADKALGVGRVRPSIGLGATFGTGALYVEDRRALDGSLSLGHTDYGPELQLGMRWVDGGVVDNRVFVSFAYLFTALDERLRLDPVDGVAGTRGLRASVGMNWADRMARSSQSRSSLRHEEESWLFFLIPQQAEIAWERSAGSSRFGVTLSYGI